MGTVSVRYIVNDVDAAIAFYTRLLGFEVARRPAAASRSCHGATSACFSTRRPVPAEPPSQCRMGEARAGRMEPHPARGRGPRR
jgi:catechol 2,3-dioxygenase-like lactoylglutathione lyase family enzyme